MGPKVINYYDYYFSWQLMMQSNDFLVYKVNILDAKPQGLVTIKHS